MICEIHDFVLRTGLLANVAMGTEYGVCSKASQASDVRLLEFSLSEIGKTFES